MRGTTYYLDVNVNTSVTRLVERPIRHLLYPSVCEKFKARLGKGRELPRNIFVREE